MALNYTIVRSEMNSNRVPLNQKPMPDGIGSTFKPEDVINLTNLIADTTYAYYEVITNII